MSDPCPAVRPDGVRQGSRRLAPAPTALARMGVAINAPPAGQAHPMATLLVLSLPDFVTDVERRWEALSADEPLIVGGAADGPGLVVAACRAARAAGVRGGQPLREAARLLPQARFVPGILDRYAEAASMLDELVRRW